MSEGAIELAERILQVLDEGAFVTTYKYAVLMGLLDLCLERTAPDGTPCSVLTARQLAEKVVELYWGQTLPYPREPHDTSERDRALRTPAESEPESASVLQQVSGRRDIQAVIVRAILQFRCDIVGDSSLPLRSALARASGDYQRLVDLVEWKLIEMPLPRLQTVGGQSVPFLYDIAWSEGVRRSPVRDYQSGRMLDFDNTIRLLPGVAGHLLSLNGLLRPVIQRYWTHSVARINRLPEARLESFLFGVARMPTRALRRGLVDLQGGRCFYCGLRLGGGTPFDVDHFIPWARHANDCIENLVVADRGCNADKRAHLAAPGHLERWLGRMNRTSGRELADVARETGWESRPDPTRGVAASIYLKLPDTFPLWAQQGRFENSEHQRLQHLFAAAG